LWRNEIKTEERIEKWPFEQSYSQGILPGDMAYDPRDRKSIKEHADELLGGTLRARIEKVGNLEKEGNKGRFGQVLEREYFGLKTNSESRPDFEEAGVELKALPLKKVKKGIVTKERLVLNIINYLDIVSEDWETSTFLKKNSLILLIGYLYKKDESYLDHVIKLVKMVALGELAPEDLKIVRDDWNKIVGKIKACKAHELSESDTLYLSACTKGSTAESSYREQSCGPKAKQRAFSFKQRFLNALIMKDLEDAERIVKEMGEYGIGKERTFEELVVDRFKPFYGMTADAIAKRVERHGRSSGKGRFADLTRAVLGVKGRKIEEFEKAEVIAKTIRLRANGTPKEDVSFPAFKYKELVKEEWEESDLRAQLTKRFFFVIYQYRGKDLVLKGVKFWGMPEEELENEVRPVWERTIELIKEGHADTLPKKSESRIVHVRPHAQNADDTDETPQGKQVVKKCFWLNATYLKGQLG